MLQADESYFKVVKGFMSYDFPGPITKLLINMIQVRYLFCCEAFLKKTLLLIKVLDYIWASSQENLSLGVCEQQSIAKLASHEILIFSVADVKRAVMYMPCVKCSCSELKLAKHLHTFFVLT